MIGKSTKLIQVLKSTGHLGIILGAAAFLSLSTGCKAPKPPATDSSEAAPTPTPNPKISVSASASNIDIGDTVTLTAEGGTPPITWSVVSGPAAVSTDGVLTPSGSGAVQARATDSLGEFTDVYVNVRGAIQVTAPATELHIGGYMTYTMSGGAPPITPSVTQGGAEIVGNLIVALPPAGPTTIRFTDSKGAFAEVNLTVYLPVAVSPSSITLAQGSPLDLVVAGGKSPYTYSIVSGAGTVNSSGRFIAPNSNSVTVVRVTDSIGGKADATITSANILSIQPLAKTLAVNNNFTFSAVFGTAPYSYSIVSGGGTINSSTGVYQAPSSAGSAVVRVTDALGSTSQAAVTINAAIAISPTSVQKAGGQTEQFSVSGGVAPYTYSVVSGAGSINASTGLFTAPTTSDTTTIRVTDSLGNNSNAVATTVGSLSLSPANANVTINGVSVFSGNSGVPPYTYEMASGGGSINSSSGLYIAPSSSGVAQVKVTDSIGTVATANVVIYTNPTISPSAPTLAILNTRLFSASGGLGPYTYSVVSGGGSIGASTGVYSAPASSGTATVRVTDSVGGTSNANITINAALQISPTTPTMAINSTLQFSVAGGVPPISYSVVSGGGTISSSTGLYSSTATPGSVSVRAIDSVGNISLASLTVEPPVQISPSTKSVAINNTTTFTAIGGQAPYSFSKVSGIGSINSSTGVYTAPGSTGSAVVRITDALGNSSDASITINNALGISTTSAWMVADSTITFTASNGVPPYTYSVSAGTGFVNSSSGLFTAPSSAETATIRVTDSANNTAEQSISVLGHVALSPAESSVQVSSGITFSATGGQSPYTFSIVSGGGSINPSTGAYTAPGSPAAVVIRATDVLGITSTTNLTVYNPLSLSPLSVTVGPSYPIQFSGSGGVGTITYSIVSGGGLINSSTGAFTAPVGAGTVTVRATDSASNTVDATVTVGTALTISPSIAKIATYSTQQFTASGGSGGLVFSVAAGGGSVNSGTGLYTSSTVAESVTVRVTDSFGYTANATLSVIAPAKIVSGNYNSCVIFSDGSLKCWGEAGSGQLLSGGTADRGDAANEMGINNPFVNVGTGLTVKDLDIGGGHMCAILSNDKVKCWGLNNYGQLGLGDILNKGDGAGESGDSLPYVDLGTGRTAKKIAAGTSHSCAILDNNQLKCWGRNNSGQLGLGDTTSRGTTSGQMGDSLPVIALGVGKYAKEISAGGAHTCAILNDDTMKCWGANAAGQLLIGSTSARGDGANEMGDFLVAGNLGTSVYATSVLAGTTNNCAILNTGAIKCWGNGTSGKLGIGSTATIGDAPGELGNALVASNMGTGLTVLAASQDDSGSHTCSILSNDTVKCWGLGTNGALGLGNSNTIGDAGGEMGDLLPAVDLGSGVYADQISLGIYHACVLTDDKRVKCFGRATSGALGNASTTNHLGDAPADMGANLPYLNF